MHDTTKLEGIFNDIKESVDRLDDRMGAVEHRVIVISHEVNEKCIGDKVILAVPINWVVYAHMALGVIIAILVFRVFNCVLHGGI